MWTTIEWAASVLGVGAVWGFTEQKRWGFYLSFLASTGLVLVFFRSGLYGDTLANVLFVVMSLEGMFRWKAHESSQSLQNLNKFQWAWVLGALIGFWLIWYGVFSGFAGSDRSAANAGVLSLSLVAQWLLNRRYRENWLLWTLSNTISLYLCLVNGLWGAAVLYGLYWILGIKGAFHWYKPPKGLNPA
jgi:nicotinamide mononucleotide transporter